MSVSLSLQACSSIPSELVFSQSRDIILGKVFAVHRQLVVLQPRQHLPQLHEEPFARSVAVGKHVEGGAQALGEVTQQGLVGL